MTGRYGLVIMRALRLAGAATVLALGAFIVVMVRRERRRASHPHPAPRTPHAAPRSSRHRLAMWSGTPLFPRAGVDDGQSRRRAVFLPARAHGLLLAADRRADRRSSRCSYRRRAPEQRRRSACTAAWLLEIAWTVIPFLITMVIFVWGASVFFAMSRPPDETLNIYVVGKQWMWKFQHLDGQREINELHVPVGRPVKLIMTSEDVIHDFFVPAFRVKADVLPGRYTQHLVPADQAGTLSPVLRRVLRHAALGNDRRGRRDGAERVPGLAERRRAGRIARLGRRRSCSRISRATPAIAPTRRAAGRCSKDLFGKTRAAAERRDGRSPTRPTSASRS